MTDICKNCGMSVMWSPFQNDVLVHFTTGIKACNDRLTYDGMKHVAEMNEF